MPIIRLKSGNEHPNKELGHTEVKTPRRPPQREFLPRRTQLLAIIAHLRHNSSTTRIDASNRLIEKSRRTIFETEVRLTKGD
jgi:hypothetical protein